MDATNITINDLLTYRITREVKPGYTLCIEEDHQTKSWVIWIADSWTLDPVDEKRVFDSRQAVNEYLKMAQEWA